MILEDFIDSPKYDMTLNLLKGIRFIKIQILRYNVFVHCQKGISRSGSVVVGFVMDVHKIGFDKALRFVKSKRPYVAPNQGFVF